MSLEIALFSMLDEQTLVNFTGRVNVQDRQTHQHLGVVILKDGQVLRCQYRGVLGLKAFYNIVIEGVQLVAHEFIVEPEIIDERDRQIHYPYSVLKNKASEVLARYQQVAPHRPPGHVRLLPCESFLSLEGEVSEAEFTVLCSLTEWSRVEELYRHCPLLDYEITEALVSLRKKEALRVISARSPS